MRTARRTHAVRLDGARIGVRFVQDTDGGDAYSAPMLYDPTAFEPLIEETWDEARVRRRIAAIVADADESFDPDAFWEPVEDWDAAGGSAPLPLTTLYRGASGVVFGLDVLREREVADSRLDLAAIARRAYELWRANPAPERTEPPVRTHAGLFDGDSGILIVAYRL